MANSIIELYTQVPADLEGNVFGQFDEHLKLIERTLNVTLISRDGMLKILGTEQSAIQATGDACRKRQYYNTAERKLCTVSCHGGTKSGTHGNR